MSMCGLAVCFIHFDTEQMISDMLNSVLAFLDLLLTLTSMLQKLEFLYKHVAHPDVAIFFWILDILHCTPRYVAPARPLNFCNYTFCLKLLWKQETEADEQRQSLYSRFHISGRDIAAFFTDCGSDCQNCTLVDPAYNNQPTISPALKDSDDFYSLIDRCGMAVIVDQVLFVS